jgi:glycosyltransferase involved in cell wall biosynthesis
VSTASREELVGFWRWQQLARTPDVCVLALGADFTGSPRRRAAPAKASRRIVCVGILEPRKNQGVLLDAFESLRREGVDIELHLVGRVNPHFGWPLRRRVEELSGRWPGLHHDQGLGDDELAELLGSARATAFASIAEGCGLPLLESLWMGVPCLCSDLPPLAENAAAGGCDVVAGNAREGWTGALRRILQDDAWHARLAAEAASRPLPTWAATARAIRAGL